MGVIATVKMAADTATEHRNRHRPHARPRLRAARHCGVAHIIPIVPAHVRLARHPSGADMMAMARISTVTETVSLVNNIVVAPAHI